MKLFLVLMLFPVLSFAQSSASMNQINGNQALQKQITQQMLNRMQQQVEQNKIFELQTRIISNVDKFEKEEENKKKIEADIQESEQKLNEAKKELDLLSQSASKEDAKIKEAQKHIEKQQKKLDKAKEKLAETEKKMAELNQKIEADRRLL